MCANFGDTRSRDRKLRHKRTENQRFFARKVIDSLIIPKALDVRS